MGNGKIVITVPTEYAEAVEFGTAPHIIVPKNKKALAFSMDKKKVIVKKVKHPGTRPQPYMRPAMHKAVNIFIEKRIRQEFGS